MNFNTAEINEELVSVSEKIAKGYKTLEEIGEVEVGTTPKELVWSMDKIKMYHYLRDTPAKCTTPVLVSFAMLNRHDVLDLQPDRSLVKKLVDEGLDVYIMDWGYHNKQEAPGPGPYVLGGSHAVMQALLPDLARLLM